MMKILSKIFLIAAMLTGMLLGAACSQTSAGYTVYQGYNYPNYGHYYGRGLYNRPTGFGGGGPTEPPDPRPHLPVNKAE